MDYKPILLKRTATPQDNKKSPPPHSPQNIQDLLKYKQNKIGWRTPRVEEQTLPLWPGTAEVALGFVTTYEEGYKASKDLRISVKTLSMLCTRKPAQYFIFPNLTPNGP